MAGAATLWTRATQRYVDAAKNITCRSLSLFQRGLIGSCCPGICTSAVKPCVQRLRSQVTVHFFHPKPILFKIRQQTSAHTTVLLQTGLPRAGPASLNGRLVQGSAHTCSAAAPLRLDSPMDAARRAQIAEETGYRTVGAELPDDVTLGDVVSSLPKDVRMLLFACCGCMQPGKISSV